MDKGTLWQLRNLVNRRSVSKDASKNVKATEDFLSQILLAYVINAAKEANQLLQSTGVQPTAKKIAQLIVSSFTTVNTAVQNSTSESACSDLVQMYSKEVLTLGLMWLGFKDATKEGDGDRVIRYWRFFLLLFKSTRKQNYSVEAARLLIRDCLLSPRLQAQNRFSRFVNTQGRPGANIPLDLHMEHLNRVVKDTLSHMGSNITDKSIDRAGRSVGVVANVCSSFTKPVSGSHKPPSCERDLKAMVKCLDEVNPFACISNRKYSSFSFSKSLLQKLDRQTLIPWLKQQHYLYMCNL